jgi:hypothetical protein
MVLIHTLRNAFSVCANRMKRVTKRRFFMTRPHLRSWRWRGRTHGRFAGGFVSACGRRFFGVMTRSLRIISVPPNFRFIVLYGVLNNNNMNIYK